MPPENVDAWEIVHNKSHSHTYLSPLKDCPTLKQHQNIPEIKYAYVGSWLAYGVTVPPPLPSTLIRVQQLSQPSLLSCVAKSRPHARFSSHRNLGKRRLPWQVSTRNFHSNHFKQHPLHVPDAPNCMDFYNINVRQIIWFSYNYRVKKWPTNSQGESGLGAGRDTSRTRPTTSTSASGSFGTAKTTATFETHLCNITKYGCFLK